MKHLLFSQDFYENSKKTFNHFQSYPQDASQAAYSAFTKGISSRWTHFQRTMPDASELFEPLENTIRDQLIPAPVGREFNDAERKILTLPFRHGGLGLTDPSGNRQDRIRTLYSDH